jgi:foldase protein PrsA
MNEFTAKPNKSVYIWMGVSGVLLVLLIIALIANPFGKGAGEGSSAVVATVNGTKITKDQLYEEMYSQGGNSLLESLITQELINQEAKKSNITVSDEDIEAELERQAAASGMSVEDMMQMFMYYYGYAEEDIREMGSQQAVIRKLLSPQIEITEEMIQQYYEENTDQFTTPEQVRASHILVDTEEEALEIVNELNKGADFAALAQERSTDTASAANGGDLDYFARGRMLAEFEEAAFSMKVGEVTKVPVKSEYGYHIIKKTDHKAESVATLEESRDKIISILEDEELYTLMQTWMTDLRANAKIEYTDKQ